jgi:tripartite motif-containing protein 71
MRNHRLQAFEPGGRFVRSFGGRGTLPGQFSSPHGLAFGPDRLLYVADLDNGRLQMFTQTGQFVGVFPDPRDPRVLDSPTDLAFCGERLYVADKGLHRVARLVLSG